MTVPVLISAPGEDDGDYREMVAAAGSAISKCDATQALPPRAGGLLLCGELPSSGVRQAPPVALAGAIEAGIPILGFGWGMHAINAAFGGRPPVRLAGAVSASPRPGPRGRTVSLGRMRTFLTLGGKVAATIGAGGAVATPGAGDFAIREAEKAPGLMASAYDMETGAIEAIEQPGFHWVIGVAWPLHRPDLLPDRFDNLLVAFLERASAD